MASTREMVTMKGVLIFDVNCGPGSFLGHSQMWCVDLPNGRYHVKSRIRRGVLISDSPREITMTPCDKSCLKNNIPDEIAEIIRQKLIRLNKEGC